LGTYSSWLGLDFTKSIGKAITPSGMDCVARIPDGRPVQDVVLVDLALPVDVCIVLIVGGVILIQLLPVSLVGIRAVFAALIDGVGLPWFAWPCWRIRFRSDAPSLPMTAASWVYDSTTAFKVGSAALPNFCGILDMLAIMAQVAALGFGGPMSESQTLPFPQAHPVVEVDSESGDNGVAHVLADRRCWARPQEVEGALRFAVICAAPGLNAQT